MTIAEQIKSFHVNKENGFESVNNYDEFAAECEQKAIDTEQDFDAESTTYEFADGSVIVWSNSEVFVYGCRN